MGEHFFQPSNKETNTSLPYNERLSICWVWFLLSKELSVWLTWCYCYKTIVSRQKKPRERQKEQYGREANICQVVLVNSTLICNFLTTTSCTVPLLPLDKLFYPSSYLLSSQCLLSDALPAHPGECNHFLLWPPLYPVYTSIIVYIYKLACF